MGSIRKRGQKWYAEVHVGGRRKGKTHNNRQAAMAWVVEQEAAPSAGPPRKPFEDLLRRYEEEVSRKKRGWKWERDRINLVCRDPIAQVRLDRLAAPDVAAWRDRRLRVVTAESVRREWTLLTHACNVAIREWHWLAENPFKGVAKPPPGRPRSRRISDDEIDRIIRATGYSSPPQTITGRVGAAFQFAIETAMRAGEIARLTWADVHARHVHLPMTKNGNARDVPLSPRALELLDELRQVSAGETVFDLTSSQISSLFRKAKARAMISDVHFHDTRREALSRLSKIFSLMELAKISGHRDLRILQEVYYAPSADDLADKLAEASPSQPRLTLVRD